MTLAFHAYALFSFTMLHRYLLSSCQLSHWYAAALPAVYAFITLIISFTMPRCRFLITLSDISLRAAADDAITPCHYAAMMHYCMPCRFTPYFAFIFIFLPLTPLIRGCCRFTPPRRIYAADFRRFFVIWADTLPLADYTPCASPPLSFDAFRRYFAAMMIALLSAFFHIIALLPLRAALRWLIRRWAYLAADDWLVFACHFCRQRCHLRFRHISLPPIMPCFAFAWLLYAATPLPRLFSPLFTFFYAAAAIAYFFFHGYWLGFRLITAFAAIISSLYYLIIDIYIVYYAIYFIIAICCHEPFITPLMMILRWCRFSIFFISHLFRRFLYFRHYAFLCRHWLLYFWLRLHDDTLLIPWAFAAASHLPLSFRHCYYDDAAILLLCQHFDAADVAASISPITRRWCHCSPMPFRYAADARLFRRFISPLSFSPFISSLRFAFIFAFAFRRDWLRHAALRLLFQYYAMMLPPMLRYVAAYADTWLRCRFQVITDADAAAIDVAIFAAFLRYAAAAAMMLLRRRHAVFYFRWCHWYALLFAVAALLRFWCFYARCCHYMLFA